MDWQKAFIILVVTIVIVCWIESILIKRKIKYIYRLPQTYIEIKIKEMPVIIYNKHNITPEDKKKFREFKYKTKPIKMLGDKTTSLVTTVKENFTKINSVNSLIDSGLTTIGNVISLKQPTESKYRIVSNIPLSATIDDKRVYIDLK
jgi:hypothetical protein